MKTTTHFFTHVLLALFSAAGALYAAAPDLIITDVWPDGGVIHYQIQNVGDADCVSSHSTALYIDGVYRTKDAIPDILKAGQRMNRVFLKDEWSCTGLKQVIMVVADLDKNVTEVSETNNTREETWYCDQQAPTITEGPAIAALGQSTCTITWKTDENADSSVLYGRRPGMFGTVANAALSTDHSITLTGLTKAAAYRFKVRSSDESGNSVESRIRYFFTTSPPDTMPPTVDPPTTRPMSQPVFPMRFDAEASDDTVVDRVAFSMDGMPVMMDYTKPFACYLDPEAIGLTPEMYFGLEHSMAASAYDLEDNVTTCQVAWAERPRCPEMELEISLGTSTTIYTPDEGISSYLGEIDVTARQKTGMTYTDIGEGSRSGVFTDTWGEVDRVEVYWDSAVTPFFTRVPSLDETDITCPLAISYLAAPSTHQVKVKSYAGMCVKTERATMRVVRQQANITATRTVDLDGSSFNATITLTNNGTATAHLDSLSEEAEGFQITVPPSSLYEATVTYDNATRRSRVEFVFSNSILAGDLCTIHYTAIPILFEGIEEYQIGENNQLSYHDSFGGDFTGTAMARVSRVDGLRPAGTVVNACRSSDYLIATNPTLLFGMHPADDVNLLLTKAAELAKVRKGVLAYYLGAGMMWTSFNRTDKIACGNIFDDWKDEIIVLDEADDRLRIYHPNEEHKIYDADDNCLLPIEISGLHANDVLLVGNFIIDADPTEPEDEIAVVDGHSAGGARGDVTLYDYQTDADDFDTAVNSTTYNPSEGDRIIAGDMIHQEAVPDSDEIILFNGDTGLVQAYYGTAPIHREWASIYEPGDLVAAGDLVTDVAGDEIIIGDMSAQQIVIYSGEGTILHQYANALQSSDSLQVGSDGLALADDSADHVYIRGIDEGSDWSTGGFDTNVHPDDAFVCGHVLDYGIQQYLLARGHRQDHYSEGMIDVVTYSESGYAEEPGDREHLNALLNPGGEWADKMGTDFTDGGYLLIIGEAEIIPAFSCSYYLAGEGTEYIEFTDNYYGNTAGDMKKPEIAVGRIIGNTPGQMICPLQASLDVAAGVKELNFDTAYCFSGGPEERHETGRSDIAEALRDKGWSVSENDEPAEDTFYSHDSDQDLIGMVGHGNWDHCWVVDKNNVFSRFDRGLTAPIVYAASCLTGRYASSSWTLGESFLYRGASVYIGATEVSYSPYNRYLSEGFCSRLNFGTPIGDALKGSKRARMGDGGYGCYQSAIYHYYGDPKLEGVAVGPLAAAANQPLTAPKIMSLQQELPPTTVQVTIPAFTIQTTGDGDVASIPGGTVLAEPGHPEVPAWPVQMMVPARYVVQDVQLTQITETSSGTNLDLIEVQPLEDSEIHPGPTLPDPDAWPDRRYDWTIEALPDGGSLLDVSIYPLRSWSESTNYTYFTQCTLNITYQASDIVIKRLWTDQKAYAVGQAVGIELFFENAAAGPSDIMAEAELVQAGAENTVYGLLTRELRSVSGLASCGWTWNSSAALPDTYTINVRLKTADGLLLAEQSTPIQLGTAAGTMQPVTTVPACFGIGDTVVIHTGFTNTGQTVLNPQLVVEIRDVNDVILERLESSTADLAAGAEYITSWPWAATRARGNCRFLAYTIYDGKTTPAQLYPELSPFVDGDFTLDKHVNMPDFAQMAAAWLSSDTTCDIAPDGGDCTVDLQDLSIIVDAWLN